MPTVPQFEEDGASQKKTSERSSKAQPLGGGPSISVLSNSGTTPGAHAHLQGQFLTIAHATSAVDSAVPNPTANPAPVPPVMVYAPPMPVYNASAMPHFAPMYANPYSVAGIFPAQPQLPATMFGTPGAIPSMSRYPYIPSYPAPYDQAQYPGSSSLYNSQLAHPSVQSATAIRQQEQEREIKKLEQQLDQLRVAEELKAEETEFLKLQDRISGLQVNESGNCCADLLTPTVFFTLLCLRLLENDFKPHEFQDTGSTSRGEETQCERR